MDSFGALLLMVVGLCFLAGIIGNAIEKLTAPLARIAVALEAIVKQGEIEFVTCNDPDCPACGGLDGELDDDDRFEPDSGGDDFRHPPRKG